MEQVDRSTWPRWVRLALWGLPTREAALVYFWLCVLLPAAFVCISVGLALAGAFLDLAIVLPFVGLAFLPAAPGYARAIRWVDRHGRWA